MKNIKVIVLLAILGFSIKSLGAEENWLLDSRFASLDIVQMVHASYPSLSKKAIQISHYSGYYSINPLLLAESLLINDSNVDVQAKNLFSIIHSNNKYSYKKMNELLGLKGATLTNVLLQMKNIGVLAKNIKQADDIPPAFDLPFDHEKVWNFNGVHTWTGADDGTPMSSIDLTESWNLVWGNDTSEDWVSAAHGGTLTVLSSCYARITHTSGWSTDYYHVDNIQFVTGQIVEAGDLIANYADSLAQAICQGGASTGPHTHFSLLKNGRRHSLSDIALSHWMIHPGTSSYDSSPNSMWLERNGQRKYAYQNILEHLNGDNVIDYLSGFTTLLM